MLCWQIAISSDEIPMLKTSIVISQSSIESDDAYDIIMSNIDILNEAFDRYLDYDDVSAAALQSYHVDYYLAQVENGGFSQFVYNSNWDPRMQTWIREGLNAMQAKKHAALFEKSAAIVNQWTAEQLQQFCDGEYFGENQQINVMSQFDDAFYALNEREDLIALNSQWLKNHPQLKVLADAEIAEYLDQAAEQIPDLDARIQAAKQNQPRYFKLIDALCQVAGQHLEQITMGDPSHEHQAQQITAWHFLTEQGHFYMLDFGDTAQMFKGDSHQLIAELDASAIPVDEAE